MSWRVLLVVRGVHDICLASDVLAQLVVTKNLNIYYQYELE